MTHRSALLFRFSREKCLFFLKNVGTQVTFRIGECDIKSKKLHRQPVQFADEKGYKRR